MPTMTPQAPTTGRTATSGRHLPAADLRWVGVLAAGLAVLALLHVVLTRLSWAGIPLQTDTGMWAYIGSRLLDGARLYADLWESKPPGIYYTFAAVIRVFGEASVTALLCLDAVVSVAVLAVTYRVARRFASRPAAAGAVCLLSLVFCHRVLADWGDNVEKFVALFEMAALLLLIGGRGVRGSIGRFLVAGACCGLAASFKQTGVVFLLAATITWIGVRVRRGAWPERWKGAIVGLWIGTAIVWVSLVAWMIHAGIFDAFWDQVVRFDLGRMTASSESERSRLLTQEHWRSVAVGLKLVAILFGPALIAAVWWVRTLSLSAKRTNSVGAPLLPGVGDGSSACRLLILCYWAMVTVPFLIAPYGFGHYLLQAAPVAAVMAAWLFDQAFAPAASASVIPNGHKTITASRSAAMLLTIAVLVSGLVPLADHFVFTLNANSSFRRSYAVLGERMEALAEVVARSTGPAQSVMLWPPDAAVSFYAKRRTPLESSNADVIFKGWLPRLNPAMPELIERLKASPPDVIVDWTRIKIKGSLPPTDGQPPSPTPEGDGAPMLSGGDGGSIDEPLLLTSPEGFSLLEPPNDAHPRPEGRALAPLKRWVRANYGGQQRKGPAVFFFLGRPWRHWEDVLLPVETQTGEAKPRDAGNPLPTLRDSWVP